MKTILLPIHDDDGANSRMQAALDIARAHGAHLNCLQTTPLTAYVASDSFGGVFVLPDLMDYVLSAYALPRTERSTQDWDRVSDVASRLLQQRQRGHHEQHGRGAA